MKLFRIYIGSKHANGAFLPDELRTVIKEELLPHFQSITLMPGEGWFRGEHETGMMVLVATEDTVLLLQCAEALRSRLHQDGVGIEFASFYHRVTAGSDLEALAREILVPFQPKKNQSRPHANREGLNPLYATTVFQATAPADGWPAAFAIITACDPDGEKTDSSENQSADLQLAADLRLIGCRHWRVTGGSPDFVHAEPGYAAELSLADALHLGRKYRQEAIFWIERDELSIFGCGSELRQEVGSWSERLALGNGLLRSTPNFDGPPSTTDETPNTII